MSEALEARRPSEYCCLNYWGKFEWFVPDKAVLMFGNLAGLRSSIKGFLLFVLLKRDSLPSWVIIRYLRSYFLLVISIIWRFSSICAACISISFCILWQWCPLFWVETPFWRGPVLPHRLALSRVAAWVNLLWLTSWSSCASFMGYVDTRCIACW